MIVRTTVVLPGGAVVLEHPRSAEDLISESEFADDERLPYWAEVWPSSHALARVVADLAPGGGRVIELGCGVGLVTIAAMRAGFDVLATDYYEDALRFTRRNAQNARVSMPSTRVVDWRAFPADLGTFDLVLASDVLYERPYAELLAQVVLQCLSPSGMGLVADPGRAALPQFIEACERIGGSVRERSLLPYEEGAIRQSIRILEVRGPRA